MKIFFAVFNLANRLFAEIMPSIITDTSQFKIKKVVANALPTSHLTSTLFITIIVFPAPGGESSVTILQPDVSVNSAAYELNDVLILQLRYGAQYSLMNDITGGPGNWLDLSQPTSRNVLYNSVHEYQTTTLRMLTFEGPSEIISEESQRTTTVNMNFPKISVVGDIGSSYDTSVTEKTCTMKFDVDFTQNAPGFSGGLGLVDNDSFKINGTWKTLSDCAMNSLSLPADEPIIDEIVDYYLGNTSKPSDMDSVPYSSSPVSVDSIFQFNLAKLIYKVSPIEGTNSYRFEAYVFLLHQDTYIAHSSFIDYSDYKQWNFTETNHTEQADITQQQLEDYFNSDGELLTGREDVYNWLVNTVKPYPGYRFPMIVDFPTIVVNSENSRFSWALFDISSSEELVYGGSGQFYILLDLTQDSGTFLGGKGKLTQGVDNFFVLWGSNEWKVSHWYEDWRVCDAFLPSWPGERPTYPTETSTVAETTTTTTTTETTTSAETTTTTETTTEEMTTTADHNNSETSSSGTTTTSTGNGSSQNSSTNSNTAENITTETTSKNTSSDSSSTNSEPKNQWYQDEYLVKITAFFFLILCVISFAIGFVIKSL